MIIKMVRNRKVKKRMKIWQNNFNNKKNILKKWKNNLNRNMKF